MPTPLLALALLAPNAEPPRLLIAPLAPAKAGGPSPNAAIGNYLASEMDKDGRVTAIVWGLSDPVFRPAAMEGKLGNDVPTLPTRAKALEVARKRGADYVVVYQSSYKDGQMIANGELYQGGRSVWKDTQNMAATLGNAKSDDDAAASIARTWLLRMSGAPLKGLAPKKAVETPNPTPGQNPIKVEDPPSPPPIRNVENLEARIGELTRAGKADAARALARDAVDADPLAPGPRTTLVRLLAAQGAAAAAAEEARRAADLLPDHPELRTDAVRRLLAVGKLREAREGAKDLRARLPEDKAARRLAAEVALANDDGEAALREIDPVLKAGPDAEASLLRALARARLGGAEGAEADMKAWSAATTDPILQAEGYAYAQRTLAAMASRAADGLLPLLQRAAAQPKSGAVRDELDAAQRQAQARRAAWSALTPPEASRKSYDAWALAHRYMSLVAADLRAFLAGNEESLTSARIDLGEAKRAMKAASGG